MSPGPGLRALVAAGYAAVIGSLMFMVSPVVLGAMARDGAFSTGELGLLGSAPMFGMFAGALAAGVAVERLRRRGTLLALVILMASAYFLLAQWHLQVAPTAVLLFVSGGAGAGLMAVGFAALSGARLPDRAFAVWIALQLATGSAAVAILGAVGDQYGLGAMIVALGALTLSPMVLTSWLPQSADKTAGRTPQACSAGAVPMASEARGRAPTTWALALTAVVLFGAGVMLVWPFMEELGRERLGSASPARAAISFSLAVSIVAALCASALAGRIRRQLPMVAATAMIAVGAWLAASAQSPAAFAAGGMLLAFGWNLIPAFQLGVLTDIDRSGRLVVLNIAFMKLGYALGPLLTGLLPGHGWYGPVSAALVLPSLLLFLWLDATHASASRPAITASNPSR